MLVRYQAALRPELDGDNNLSVLKRQGVWCQSWFVVWLSLPIDSGSYMKLYLVKINPLNKY